MKDQAETNTTLDTRIYTDFSHLKGLQRQARKLNFLPRHNSKSILSGRHGSRIRGRGLSFEELRDYRIGDDIRTIDWRVTARTGVPHVRVYAEEKDRSAVLIVDQRINMFFGTKRNMKSVTASEAAAICAYRIFAQGDRVGAVLFNDTEVKSFKPSKRVQMVEQIVRELSDLNLQLNSNVATPKQKMHLNHPLEAAARLVRHDQLIIVISDFDEIDEATEQYLSQMAAHNDVVLALVSDPISLQVPAGVQLPVSDGDKQMTLDTRRDVTQQTLQKSFSNRRATVLNWQEQLNITVLELNTAADTLSQFMQAFAVRR